MREIKFRAWDKKGKQMYVFKLRDLLESKIEFVINCDDDVTAIMQYTGLKAKDNEEICEGDVVVYDGDLQEDSSYHYQIKWDEEMLSFTLGDDIPISDAEHLVILGNIWQNPKLLESEE